MQVVNVAPPQTFQAEMVFDLDGGANFTYYESPDCRSCDRKYMVHSMPILPNLQ